MDLISIIVPFYNMEKNVKKIIQSISNQTYKNFEAILVDDGSSDNTYESIKKIIKNDHRFRCFHKTNGGVSSARNFGLKKAKGNYICFIDSDDFVDENFVELLYNSIKTNNSDISACYFKRIYGNKVSINGYDNDFCDLIKYPAPWNKMYKASLFEKYNISFLEGKWYEDLGVSAELFMVSKKISIVKIPLYNYIFSSNSSSIMHTYDNRIYQIYEIVDSIEKFAKNNKLYNKNKNNIEFIYIYHIIIGTIYRSSFTNEFNKKKIVEIMNFVNKRYPNWYQNKAIKKLSFPFKLYLFLVHNKLYGISYFLIKIFNKILKI